MNSGNETDDECDDESLEILVEAYIRAGAKLSKAIKKRAERQDEPDKTIVIIAIPDQPDYTGKKQGPILLGLVPPTEHGKNKHP